MNKTFFVILILCMVTYGIFAENLDNITADNPCADGQCGTIRELTGNVYLKPVGSSVFIAAKAGDTIALDTIVSTGFKSTAVIAAGCSVITMRPLTRLSLAENFSLNLQTGSIEVNIPEGASDCIVQSSGATAKVRGTNFEFDTANIKVNEGTAVYYGAFGPAVMVKTGGKSSIGANGKPSDTSLSSLLPSSPTGSASSGGGKSSSGGGGGGGGGGNVPSCCQ